MSEINLVKAWAHKGKYFQSTLDVILRSGNLPFLERQVLIEYQNKHFHPEQPVEYHHISVEALGLHREIEARLSVLPIVPFEEKDLDDERQGVFGRLCWHPNHKLSFIRYLHSVNPMLLDDDLNRYLNQGNLLKKEHHDNLQKLYQSVSGVIKDLQLPEDPEEKERHIQRLLEPFLIQVTRAVKDSLAAKR